MGVDAGNLLLAALTLLLSTTFTFWFTRQQTNMAIDQAVTAQESANTAQRQLALSEQAHREQAEPYVVVDIRPADLVSSIFILVIENIGPTVARNVRITFDPPLERCAESHPNMFKIRDSLPMQQGIPAMPPGRRIEWFFDSTQTRLQSDLPTAYEATVEAEGPFGRVEPLTYRVDLAMYRSIETLSVKTTHDGVKVLDKLSNSVEKIASALGSQRTKEDR
ncbi:hypothetical protein [Thermomonospora umbrina]|nr:hypothetical protein [Thermomonospora umbrina]